MLLDLFKTKSNLETKSLLYQLPRYLPVKLTFMLLKIARFARFRVFKSGLNNQIGPILCLCNVVAVLMLYISRYVDWVRFDQLAFFTHGTKRSESALSDFNPAEFTAFVRMSYATICICCQSRFTAIFAVSSFLLLSMMYLNGKQDMDKPN